MSTQVVNVPVHVTDADFDAAVGRDGVVLVDFWAPWCAPCLAIAPELDKLAAEHGDALTVAKINVDENPLKAAEFGIRAIPTMILFKDGQPVESLVGLQTRSSLEEALQRANA